MCRSFIIGSMEIKKLLEVLDNHKVINLAYSDGHPQSCALWYASDEELNLYYLSALTTRHGSVLKRGGSVAFTINKDQQDWKQIVGIQGRGTVEMLEYDEHAWKIYSSKYPFILDQFSELETALEKTKLWKVKPDWLRLIDNRISFGHKEEIVFH